jgi:hypothetical protein
MPFAKSLVPEAQDQQRGGRSHGCLTHVNAYCFSHRGAWSNISQDPVRLEQAVDDELGVNDRKRGKALEGERKGNDTPSIAVGKTTGAWFLNP